MYLKNMLISIYIITSFSFLESCYGRNVSISKPYQAQLIQPGDDGFYCGAAIISRTALLTAASCIKPNAARYQVIVGASFYNKGQTYDVTIIKLHPNFMQDTFKYDIAILKLKHKLKFSENVNRIRLSSSGISGNGAAIFYGFGPTFSSHYISKTPRGFPVSIMADHQCKKLLGRNIDESKMCGSCLGHICDSCMSHSGELLVMHEHLIGLVTRPSVCVNPALPAIYTRINGVLDFIRTDTLNLRDSKKKKKKGNKKKGNKKTDDKKKSTKTKGKQNKIESFPYYVGIAKKGGKVSCGGAIISKTQILTAGECLKGPGKYEAFIGSTKLNEGTKLDITSTKVAPAAKLGILASLAIAFVPVLIKWFKGKGRKGMLVSSIQLPKKNEKFKDGAKAMIVGYGLMKGGKPSNVIAATKMELLNPGQCKKFGDVPKNAICAGNQRTGKAACKGDSGGPLVLDNKLIGIASHCGKKGGPIIFADIRLALDFIKKNIKNK